MICGLRAFAITHIANITRPTVPTMCVPDKNGNVICMPYRVHIGTVLFFDVGPSDVMRISRYDILL